VRRLLAVLVGLVALVGGCSVAEAAPATSVSTVAGPADLQSPEGIAVDPNGNLFIADTDHCRVLLRPSHSGSMYGLRVSAGNLYVVAGGKCGHHGGLAYPTGVAVDRQGDLFIAEASAQRVVEVPRGGHHGPHAPVDVAGTGVAGYDGTGRPAIRSALNEPSGIAMDADGNLFIADTANCRVRMLPSTTGTFYGQTMQAGSLYDVAGTGDCGSADRSGPATAAQLWNPVALAVDQAGDLLIADNGDQSILEVPTHGGTYYGTAIAGGGIATVVGGQGNGPYLLDGLSATSVAAEVNDVEGIAVAPDGTLFFTDGSMHVIRVVPSRTTTVDGRLMHGGGLYTLAGALPISTSAGAGNGTKWVATRMGVPLGIATTSSGSLYFSDRADDQVRVIR
jgi:sugar lactone lactonase YvrE